MVALEKNLSATLRMVGAENVRLLTLSNARPDMGTFAMLELSQALSIITGKQTAQAELIARRQIAYVPA